MQEDDPDVTAGQAPRAHLVKVKHSLSTRAFLLVLILVTLSGILVHVPSIAGYCKNYLEHRILDAYIAILALQADPDRTLDSNLERELLDQARVVGIEFRYPHSERTLILGRVQSSDVVFDLRAQTAFSLLWESLSALVARGEQRLKIIGYPPGETETSMTVCITEESLYHELYAHSWQAISLSILISLITAVLVYLGLRWLMVRAVYRMTRSLVQFRQAPEAPESVIQPSGRADEIGLMEQELARMQTDLRAALAQQSRLAVLGRAVSRINHDLKSILSTVSIASERLARLNDPAVSRIAVLLAGSVEKAIDLCTQTLDLARGEQPVQQRSRFRLRPLVEEVGEALKLGGVGGVRWQNEVDETLTIEADRERLYRVLFNLGRNAVEALAGNGMIRIAAVRDEHQVAIEVADTGPGIPEPVRAHLFQPFTSSARSGGTGLGLATARDLVRAHGGDLKLLETGPKGTLFRLTLPAR